jgi:DNA-directed RNA polymerase specialized sigma24 family protein
LREISNPTAYLNATVVNLARNWQRGQRRRSARERHGLRIVESNDGPEVDNLHESYFAIPVSEGVELGVVEFVDASNEVVATLELPYLPRDLSGAYGGFATILPV